MNMSPPGCPGDWTRVAARRGRCRISSLWLSGLSTTSSESHGWPDRRSALKLDAPELFGFPCVSLIGPNAVAPVRTPITVNGNEKSSRMSLEPACCGGSRFVQREEALDAEFLERDVLWRAQHRDCREEVKNPSTVSKADRNHWNQRRTEVDAR